LTYLSSLKVVITETSKHFLDLDNLVKILNEQRCDGSQESQDQHQFLFKDKHEYQLWSKRGDPVLHIDLSKWAEIFLIAPLSANTLAKISNGICDNLLTCVARAWDFGQNKDSKKFIICPAMNTKMYEHPITNKQLNILKDFGNEVHVIPVIEKVLVCGDSGLGAMAEVESILNYVEKESSSFTKVNM